MPGRVKKDKKLAKAPREAKAAAPVKNRYDDILRDLETQRANLLSEMGVIISTGLKPSSENFADPGDQATAEADQNFSLRLREREQKLLKKVDEAIERIQSGTFGICESCGGEISVQRLKARPVTTLCIDCKTRQEEEEKIRQEG